MAFRLLLILGITGAVPHVGAYGQGQEVKLLGKRDDFGKTAIERLAGSDKMSRKDLKELSGFFQRWKKNQTKEDVWNEFNAKIADFSKSADVWCYVTITTVDDKRVEQKGAQLKYRLTGRKNEKTTHEPARCENEKMSMGEYHIWAEEKGKPISNQKSTYQVTEMNQSITITLTR